MTLQNYEPTGFAAKIFKDRYAIHPDETFQEACRRVANFMASAEEGERIKHFEERFFDIISTNRFSPGGRIWRGAGRKKSACMNCFCLPSDDSREGWGQLLKEVTIISGLGGGVGISFDAIRPRGTEIKGTGGISTGSVSLMKILNGICNELREGGNRRSALLFGLSYWHPDIEEFLDAKLNKKELSNANISVLIDNKFLELVKSDGDIELRWQDVIVKTIKAKWLYNKIIINAHKSGEPGILNIGLANDMNNLHYCRDITISNPCGEIVASPYSSCCLGSIVLSSFVKDNDIDWALLDDVVRLAVRFLDNLIDKNEYPLSVIKEWSQKERRIGLGTTGLADMLIKLNLKYSSEQARQFVDKTMAFIKKKAYEASIFLAVEKGQFPLLNRGKFIKGGFCRKSLTPSLRKKILEYGIRNCCILTCPPTGTTSKVASCSSGIEPIFHCIYRCKFNSYINNENGRSEIIVHPLFREFVVDDKSLNNFENAHDISPENHIKMQVICQKHIDGAISKSLNISNEYSVDDLFSIILENISSLKGITIYRDGSRGESPLTPIPPSEAQQYLDQMKEKVIVSDCSTGTCDT